MKTFFLGLFAFVFISANAQKGSWYLGGNAGFSSTQNKFSNGTVSVDGGKSTNWSFSPEVGTFVTNHVQIGVGITMSGNKIDNQSTPVSNINKSTLLGGTIYSRYFFGKEAFKPFVGLNVTAQSGDSKNIIGTTTNDGPDVFTFGSNINGGFGYAISKRFTTVGSFGFLGFNRITQKSGTAKTTITNFGIDAQSLGNRFNIGFYYTL